MSDAVGRGVFATADLSAGTIVWTQDASDEVYRPDDVARMSADELARLAHFGHREADGTIIVCTDAGRLVNHRCDPNLRGIGPWAMAARRTIHAGEEITCDYAECNIDRPLACQCGATACRGTIHGSDLARLAPAWDAEVLAMLASIRSCAQPLGPHLLDRSRFELWVSGHSPIPSLSALHAAGPA